MKDVLDALRRNQSVPPDAFLSRATLGEQGAKVWHELDEAITTSSANRTLRDVLSEREPQPDRSSEISTTQRSPIPAE